MKDFLKMRKKINLIILLSILGFFAVSLTLGLAFLKYEIQVIKVMLIVASAILFSAIFANMIYVSWYDRVSHSYIEDLEKLSLNTKIINVKRETVGLKGSRVFRTIVLFDDGFTYISHKTDVASAFVSYKISVTEELALEILNDAMEAHKKAISKLNRQ